MPPHRETHHQIFKRELEGILLKKRSGDQAKKKKIQEALSKCDFSVNQVPDHNPGSGSIELRLRDPIKGRLIATAERGHRGIYVPEFRRIGLYSAFLKVLEEHEIGLFEQGGLDFYVEGILKGYEDYIEHGDPNDSSYFRKVESEQEIFEDLKKLKKRMQRRQEPIFLDYSLNVTACKRLLQNGYIPTGATFTELARWLPKDLRGLEDVITPRERKAQMVLDVLKKIDTTKLEYMPFRLFFTKKPEREIKF